MHAPKTVFVIGGLNEDIKARPFSTCIPRTSNPGRVYRAPGGVARNIAHSLALLGSPVTLCSAAGRDSGGDSVLSATAAAGVDTTAVFRFTDIPTGTYVAIQDETGNLAAAVSSMEIMDALTPAQLSSIEGPIASAAALILDTNLRTDSLSHIVRIAHRHGVPCIAEPVSVEKSTRLSEILPYCSWICPNSDELCKLFSLDSSVLQGVIRNLVNRSPQKSTPLPSATTSASSLAAPSAAPAALDFGPFTAALTPSTGNSAPHILVTLGEKGVLLLSRDPKCNGRTALSPPHKSETNQWWAWWHPPVDAEVVDSNGAGDAFIAGFTAAFTSPRLVPKEKTYRGNPAESRATTVAEAVQLGQAAAALTLESPHTVTPYLSSSTVAGILK